MTDHHEQISGLMPIGALAGAAGLSVRALHHYDAIGLLTPEERTHSGRRLYSEANVRRLYRIAALRGLGLALDEISAILDRDPDLVGAVRRHLGRVERRSPRSTDPRPGEGGPSPRSARSGHHRSSGGRALTTAAPVRPRPVG